MNTNRTAHHTRIALALALVLAIGLLGGCGPQTPATPTPVGKLTAQAAFKIAKSTLSTAAPDGKLLVARTTQPLTPTSTPVWDYIVGSPKTDLLYEVMIQDGKGQFQEYTKAGLTAAEWATVPAESAWKLDSDAAYQKAIAVYPQGKTSAFYPSLLTYVPPTAPPGDYNAMKWVFNFDPASKGTATTSTVVVDMVTGQAALATAAPVAKK